MGGGVLSKEEIREIEEKAERALPNGSRFGDRAWTLASIAQCLQVIRSYRALEAENARLLEVLKTIREAPWNDDSTAGWMQIWAAWGMEPHKWPKPCPEPLPKRTPSSDHAWCNFKPPSAACPPAQ